MVRFISLVLLLGLASVRAEDFVTKEAEGRNREGEAAFQARNYVGAQVIFEALAEEYPENVPILFNRGLSRMKNGHFGEAEADLLKVLRLDPQSGWYVYGTLGILYEATKQPHEAAAAFEQALKFDPNNPNIRNELKILREQQRK